MALGARFQMLKGVTIREVVNFSKGQGELNLLFLQTCYFCGNIVINYSCHYLYSNIFDMAEFLPQNNHGPI